MGLLGHGDALWCASLLSPCVPFPETENTSGNPHRYTVTSVLDSEMWGTSAVVVSICCSLQAIRLDPVNWVSMSPSPSNRWILVQLYSVNLGYLVTFVRVPSEKLELTSVYHLAQSRKNSLMFTSVIFPTAP